MSPTNYPNIRHRKSWSLHANSESKHLVTLPCRIQKLSWETDFKLMKPQLVHNWNQARQLLTNSRLWISIRPKLSDCPIMNRAIIKFYAPCQNCRDFLFTFKYMYNFLRLEMWQCIGDSKNWCDGQTLIEQVHEHLCYPSG